MAQKTKILGVAALGLIFLILLWVTQSNEFHGNAWNGDNAGDLAHTERKTNPSNGTPSPLRESDGQREARLKNEILKALGSPVNFWGKVIDEHGNPIAGAKVEMSIIDKFSWNPEATDNRSNYVQFSDSKGLFSLLGKSGASIHVKVQAEGFAPAYDKKTNRNLSQTHVPYSGKFDRMHIHIPTETNPLVFVLRKKSPIANLAYLKKHNVPIDKKGTPQKIALKTDKKTLELEISCWSSCPVPFTYEKYDWRAEIRIAGAKLRTITEFNPVIAPTDGYQEVFTVDMPKSLNKGWKATNIKENDFWIRFEDGTYAKACIEIITGRTHEVDAEVWFNFDGTNNFEQ